MKIKKLMAGVLACFLLAMNLAGVCAANGTDEISTIAAGAAEDAGSTAASGTDAVVVDNTGTEQDAGGEPDTVTLTLGSGSTIAIPYGSMEEWKEMLAGADSDSEDGKAVTGKVNVSSSSRLNLRSGSGTSHDIIGKLLAGDELEIIGEEGNWYQVVVKERTGYVYKDYVDVVEQPETDSKTDDDMMALFFNLITGGQIDGGGAGNSSAGLTPDGNLTLVDDYLERYGDGSGKQFITVTTKDGNYFYLVIDRDEKGNENVHFMNLVDEADLLALMEEDEAEKYASPVEPEEPPMTETAEPDEEKEELEEEPEEKPGTNMPSAMILVFVLIGGGCLFVFTKLKGQKKKQEQEKPDPDADYMDGTDEEDFELPDDADDAADEEDDSTMFDAEDNEPV